MPDFDCQARVERARWKLDDALRRVAARLGNRKAAIGWLARQIGAGPSALETLLYHRRGSARLAQAVERAWMEALLAMLRRDLEALEHELAVAPEDDVADLARAAGAAVAELQARLAQMEEVG